MGVESFIDRVVITTRVSPPVEVPVAPRAGVGGGGVGGIVVGSKQSIFSFLQPTVQVYFAGASDPVVVAPWGQAPGTYAGVVVLASVSILALAAAFAAGRASR